MDRPDCVPRLDDDRAVPSVSACLPDREVDGHGCALPPAGVSHGDERMSLPMPGVADARGIVMAMDGGSASVPSEPGLSETSTGVSSTRPMGPETVLHRGPDVQSTCSELPVPEVRSGSWGSVTAGSVHIELDDSQRVEGTEG